ncbi:acetoin utilization protein AcuC [Ferviditalea candida]|uniref:Acetoin utilization protein AcuC n=1 Tax=Ferviditalea candida TaxID=3108399 RepID=A0ABU5ZNR9_9BACL|nr:acetoin utilization protein AcuC [Paenibacillaceae bacterium T2]
MSNTAFIFHEDVLKYKFNDQHPFRQERLILTLELLKQLGALNEEELIRPRKADEHELLWVHTPGYIEAVKQLSVPAIPPSSEELAEKYGFHTEDTPYFENMHEVTSAIVGGSIEAAEQVMSGKALHALHLGGGLHHAMKNKSSGFCIYNDASVAISYIRHHYGAKVLYIDTDVHHGDGVQFSFYSDPNVCTFSIHETGKYLFPGTGAVNERGDGEGFGACFNMPVEPYTEDESWLESFQEYIEKVAAFFQPDVIVSQHGCDAHYYDPLSHIHCSMKVYLEMPKIIHELAHKWCGGKWIALGGGGYDIWRVVPRAWSLLWLIMNDHAAVKQIENNPLLPLPGEWLKLWNNEQAPDYVPATWLDAPNAWEDITRRKEITQKNRKTKEIGMLYLPK